MNKRMKKFLVTVAMIATMLSTEVVQACMFLDGRRIESQAEYNALTDEEKARVVNVGCIAETQVIESYFSPAKLTVDGGNLSRTIKPKTYSATLKKPLASVSIRDMTKGKMCNPKKVVVRAGRKYRIRVFFKTDINGTSANMKMKLPTVIGTSRKMKATVSGLNQSTSVQDVVLGTIRSANGKRIVLKPVSSRINGGASWFKLGNKDAALKGIEAMYSGAAVKRIGVELVVQAKVAK